jgi:hypothetical protein
VDFPSVWKASSIFLTGAFGVLGLLTEFKHKETRRITKWGYISLVGICVTTTFGVAAQIIQTSTNSTKALKLAQKADAALEKEEIAIQQIQRLQSPLGRPTLELEEILDCGGISKRCRLMYMHRDHLYGHFALSIFKNKADSADIDIEQPDMSIVPVGNTTLLVEQGAAHMPMTKLDYVDIVTLTAKRTDVQNYNHVIGAADIVDASCVVYLQLKYVNDEHQTIDVSDDTSPAQISVELDNGEKYVCQNFTRFEYKGYRPWLLLQSEWLEFRGNFR